MDESFSVDPEPLHMHIDFIDWKSEIFLHIKPDRVGYAASHGFDPCAVLNDDVDVDIDLVFVIFDFNSMSWVLDDHVGDTGDQILGSQPNDAIRFNRGIVRYGGDCSGGDIDAAIRI